ncbi:DUF6766 family protein [Streptomyces sp. NPDC002467]|uniref:DUF6766 family protein n=1 Tax=Streptomyces sp. NPDC002467 TaxID=3364647 RepID=UPI0036AF1DE6
MQNWQSELLAVAAMVVLSFCLRRRGSPESRPVGAAHTRQGSKADRSSPRCTTAPSPVPRIRCGSAAGPAWGSPTGHDPSHVLHVYPGRKPCQGTAPGRGRTVRSIRCTPGSGPSEPVRAARVHRPVPTWCVSGCGDERHVRLRPDVRGDRLRRLGTALCKRPVQLFPSAR